MAKKKPAYKNLRQGQTIYMIEDFSLQFGKPAKVVSYFIHSSKTQLPPEGYIIEKLPVSFLKNSIKRLGNKNLFFSRKKANSALKLHYENNNRSN